MAFLTLTYKGHLILVQIQTVTEYAVSVIVEIERGQALHSATLGFEYSE